MKMASIIVLFPAFFLTTVLTVSTNSTDDKSNPNYRLPLLYELHGYVLDITILPEVFTGKMTSYTGTIYIQFSHIEVTDYIVLHAHPDFIQINSLKFNNLDLDTYSIDNVTHKLTVDISTRALAAKTIYSLIINYTGRLNTETFLGFYRSSYVENNVTKYLATTKFEPTYARQAFPCFDEPSFKATFDVSITYPSNLKVIFNTPEINTNINDSTGLTTKTFERTPLMSTYLIAFIISEFTCSDGDPVGGVIMQVCSRGAAAAERKWAIQVTSKILAELNTFTNYKYTLTKMVQVAIPDFASGAMENWGLVTYREELLLWNEDGSTNTNKQIVATVIAHEFAHQWFGNLVTCKWWSELFLNEGFANYFEYHATHKVLNSWELDKQFLLEQVFTALVADGSKSSLALQSDVNSPTEIKLRFNAISYNKGGSILRMVSHFLGFETFKKGLQVYLSENQYSTALPEHLWNALDTQSDVSLPADTLEEVMRNWVTKSGYPLVTVKLDGEGNVTITQERFLITGRDDTKWYVPISYTTSKDIRKFESTMPKTWLTPTRYVVMRLAKDVTWIIINNQHTGYYRVNYDDILWSRIRTALASYSFDGITELNRAQIVNDLFHLADARKVNYTLCLDTIKFLAKDTSYYPWYAAFNGYNFMLKNVGRSALGTAISNSILSLMQNLYTSVPIHTLNTNNIIYTYKQVLTLSWACKLRSKYCIENIRKMYKNYRDTGKRPDSNLRYVVYCNSLRYSSDVSDWEFLWDAYLNATGLSAEQSTILSALGCTMNKGLLKKYLMKTITDGSGISSKDILSVYISVLNSNFEGPAAIYDFLVENYKQIAEKYHSMYSIESIMWDIVRSYKTEVELNKFKDLISQENLPEVLKNAAKKALKAVNFRWIETFGPELMDYYNIPREVIQITTGGTASYTLNVYLYLLANYLLISVIYNTYYI